MHMKNGSQYVAPAFLSPEYKRSRTAYIFQAGFEYLGALLVADAYLAKLLGYLQISDAVIGVLSSLISLVFVVQIFAVSFGSRVQNVKRTVILFAAISQLLLLSLYLLPFGQLKSGVLAAAVVTAAIFLGYSAQYLVSNIMVKWANSFVAPEQRGLFSANKEIVSLAMGIVFTLLVGYAFDALEAKSGIKSAFGFLAVTYFVVFLLNMLCLLFIDNKPVIRTEKKTNYRLILSNTLCNRRFRAVILQSVLRNVAVYFTVGFMGVFKTKDLLLSVFAVQLINILGNLVRILASRPFGRYTDRTSFAKGMEQGFLLMAAAFFVNIFTNGSRWYLIIVFTVLYHAAQAGLTQNSINITYSYVPSEYIVEALSIKNCLSGVAGFISSLIAGGLLNHIQDNENMLFGFRVCGQQILSAVSCGIVLLAYCMTKFVIEKQPVMKQ